MRSWALRRPTRLRPDSGALASICGQPACQNCLGNLAVAPRGWHGGIGNSPYCAGLDALFSLIASLETGLSSRSCANMRRT
jgi:hypothetical protein